MFLRLLVPITLLFPVLALVVEASSLRDYRGTPGRELAALLISIVVYFAAWFGLDALVRSLTGSSAAALVAASLLALFALQPGLFLGFKLFGVRKASGSTAGSH